MTCDLQGQQVDCSIYSIYRHLNGNILHSTCESFLSEGLLRAQLVEELEEACGDGGGYRQIQFNS